MRVVGAGVVACSTVAAIPARADEITYGYDALSRLTSVSVNGATAYYDYDAAGNIVAIRRQMAGSTAPSIGGVGPSAVPNDEVSISSIASTKVSR